MTKTIKAVALIQRILAQTNAPLIVPDTLPVMLGCDAVTLTQGPL